MGQQELDEPATETVRRLLYDGWTPANTAEYDPTLDPAANDAALPMHFGNYTGELPDPQVSITQPQGETTVGGRWSGSNSATGEMNQLRRGMILVQCWAETGRTYGPASDLTADELLPLLRHEVERILGGQTRGPASGANSGVIWSFSTQWDGRFADPQTDSETPMMQSQVRVTYDWERTA